MFLPDYLSVSFPLPPPGPDKGPVCLSVDVKWLPYILGCLKALTVDSLYTSDVETSIGDAYNLLGIFESALNCPIAPEMAGSEIEDCMGCCIRMRNGVLQVLSCGEWVAVDGWDASQIAPAQPGIGSQQPGPGKCQSFTGIISPVGSWLLPVPVSSGDVVTIKNLQGAWTPSAFTDIWDCPDGNLYFAGGCINGTAGFDSGAPMPSAPLNGTLFYDGTNYYDVSAAANESTPVAITILPGITAKQLIVRCNFHGGVDPSGEVSFDIEVCNNQTPNWTHDISFVSTPGGFVPDDTFYSTLVSHSVYVPSNGWEAGHYQGGGQDIQVIAIDWDFGFTAHIDSLTLTYNRVVGTNPQGDTLDAVVGYRDSGHVNHNLTVNASAGTGLSVAFPAAQVCDGFFFFSQQDAGNSPYTPTGSGKLYRLQVSGHGTDPFAGY